MDIGKASKKMILVLIALLFILSGCARFDVDLVIDRNNTVYLSYRLEMDISEFDEQQQLNFRIAMHELAIHYQDELGFGISLDIESSPIVLLAERRVVNNSFEEAFDSLESMLTDADMSIFMQVDMGMVSYPRHTGYIIGATLDVPRIIKSYDTENLPPAFQASLEDALQTSRGTITISLPADESVSASHGLVFESGQATMSVPISFSGETAFDLSATFVGTLGRTMDGSIGEIIERQLVSFLGNPNETAIEQQVRFRSIAMNAAIAAAALIAITLIVTVVVVVVKRMGRR